MKHLILVGACYLDTILSVPHYPAEDSKLRASDLKIRRGGNCPNSLEVLQQLIGVCDAARLYLVSSLPRESSLATKRIISSFGDNTQVDFKHCLFRQEHVEAASSYIIRSGRTGSRTLVNYNDLPEITPNELDAIIQSFNADEETWWHFEGRIPETTLECIRSLRKTLPAARISVEVEKPGREGLLELAAEADVVFYSRSWAEDRGHKSAEECLLNEEQGQPYLSLCTWGADGAAALSQSSHCIHCAVASCERAISVVDTVGAGDTFIAGMLYALACRGDDWDIGRGLRFAVNLATLKVQREGFEGLGAHVLER